MLPVEEGGNTPGSPNATEPGKEEGEAPSKVSGAEPAVEVVDEARPLRALETFPGPALNIDELKKA